ncbi:hypothetical protein ACUXZZ_23195 [Streptomyces graminifolii]|uniref:hypothetical protein n=1 Tax=Streptomyces graminifolii TaxID=1266771 RepID=UPI00405A26B9
MSTAAGRGVRDDPHGAGLLVQLLVYGGMSGFVLVLTSWPQSGRGLAPALTNPPPWAIGAHVLCAALPRRVMGDEPVTA